MRDSRTSTDAVGKTRRLKWRRLRCILFGAVIVFFFGYAFAAAAGLAPTPIDLGFPHRLDLAVNTLRTR